uniref:RPW8 domain-containing protein n=1 Tax=Quercus lobata TaxID=97700 RepID=A0A7N2LZN9_QUELO
MSKVLLYDASRKLIDSRFLNKGEAIRSGESIAFDAHLIDIGEPEGNYKSPADLIHLNIQGKDGNIIKKSGLMHGQQDCHKDRKSIVKAISSCSGSELSKDAAVGDCYAHVMLLLWGGADAVGWEGKKKKKKKKQQQQQSYASERCRASSWGRIWTGLNVVTPTVKDVIRNARQFKHILKRLDSTLDFLTQAVEDIERSNQQRGRAVENTQSLIEEMTKRRELVRNSLQIPWWNLVLIVKCSSKLSKLEEDILRFCQVDLQLHGARTVLETREIVSGIRESMDSTRSMETPRVSCAVRQPPVFTVGFDMPIKELKTLLLKEEVQLLLLTAPGGCKKTTLVKMLCQDKEIKGTFKENFLFVNVSKTPNVKVIVQILFSHKGLQPMFEIQSDEDAIEQLQQLLEHIGSDPILLILDDVWLGSESLPEKFGFKIPNHKIMVTSRTAFPRYKFTYNLNPLNDKDAMTLFRHSASLQDGGGLTFLKKISKTSDIELLGQLQKSLEFQDDKVIKDCFMDLGSFPEDQRIYAAALIDMWAELYELDEDGIHAIANLLELTTRNLANLVMASSEFPESDF